MTEHNTFAAEDWESAGFEIVSQFATWIAGLPEVGGAFTPELMTGARVRAYLATLQSVEQRVFALFVLKGFGQWLYENGVLAANPVEGVELS
jgi:hypothetical protein